MKKHLKAAAIGTTIIVVTGLLPYIQILNLVFFFWVWVAMIFAIKDYAKSSGKTCSVKDGIIIGIITALLSSILWLTLFYISSSFNQIDLTSFQNAAAQINIDELKDKVSPSQHKYLTTTIDNFATLEPAAALKKTIMLLIPLLTFLLIIFCSCASLMSVFIFGDPPSSIPEKSL